MRVPALLFLLAPVLVGAQTVTIHFDNTGPEAGVTPSGVSDFEYMGSVWSGGVVGNLGVPFGYASGSFSYEVFDTAAVQFSAGVSQVRFFFVHGSTVPAGEAIMRDGDGLELARLASNAATRFGDSENFVEFAAGGASIWTIEFTGGAIDAFSFDLSPEGGFLIDQRIEGGWFNPATPGQGVLFDYIPGERPRLFAAWFAFEIDTGVTGSPYQKLGSEDQRWFTAQGEITAPDTAELTLFSTSGGAFNSDAETQTTAVGTLVIEFSACNAARARYEFTGGLVGGFSLVPIDPSVADCR